MKKDNWFEDGRLNLIFAIVILIVDFVYTSKYGMDNNDVITCLNIGFWASLILYEIKSGR